MAAHFEMKSTHSTRTPFHAHDREGFDFTRTRTGRHPSGRLHLKAREGSGRLVFRDLRPGATFGTFEGGSNHCHKDAKVAIDTGLLFPLSNGLEHFVEPHEGDESRISIAFNAKP